MKLVFRYGLITGIVAVVWKYIEFRSSITQESLGGMGGFIPYLILFAGIAAGIFFRRRSDEFGHGVLPFKEGARTGVVISLVAGMCLAGYSMFHCLVINPDYLDDYVSFVKETLENQHETAAIIEQEIEEVRRTGSVGRLMFASFTSTLVIGMAGTFITAALFKSEGKNDL